MRGAELGTETGRQGPGAGASAIVGQGDRESRGEAIGT